MAQIQTHSGRAFDLLNPTPDMIHWSDIAVSLARLNRFHGHTTWCEWSVAQHSVLAMAHAKTVNEIADKSTMLALLLHDAAEAYCADLDAPLRVAMRRYYLDCFGGGGLADVMDDPYMAVYHRVQEAVRLWAGLPEGAFDTPTVKHVDLRMLATERELFLARPWIDGWIDLPPPYVTEADLAPPSLLIAKPADLVAGRANVQLNPQALIWAPWDPPVAAQRFTQCLIDLAPQLLPDLHDIAVPWLCAPSWVTALHPQVTLATPEKKR